VGSVPPTLALLEECNAVNGMSWSISGEEWL
jgi:hypothetical protein